MFRMGMSLGLQAVKAASIAVLLNLSAAAAFAEDAGGVAEMFEEGPLKWSNDSAIFAVVVFVLLLLILWRFAWGPISEGLNKREQGIRDNIATAERKSEDAKQFLAQYEAKLAAAAGEVRELLEEARRDAEHTKEEIVAAARKEAQAEKERALSEIGTARDQALKELAERSADMAVDLAGRIIKAKMTKEDHAALIREAVGSFAQAKASNN